MRIPAAIFVLFLTMCAFGAGVLMGWDSGVRDARNLTVQTP